MSAILKRDFPPMPKLMAEWAPIYMEPIMKSGERITVGVAAIPASGEPIVMTALHARGLKCAFGANGLTLMDSAAICLDAMKEHLLKSRSFTGWDAPFHGVELGVPRMAAGNTVAEILQTALRMTACFSALDPLPADAAGDDEQTLEDDNWPRAIRAEVKKSRPRLEDYFGRPFKLVQNGLDTKFDYLGSRYAAFFGKVFPARRKPSIDSFRARILKLALLREAPGTLTLDRWEVLIGQPPLQMREMYRESELQNMDEALTEIAAEGKKVGVGTETVVTAAEAANQILVKDALEAA